MSKIHSSNLIFICRSFARVGLKYLGLGLLALLIASGRSSVLANSSGSLVGNKSQIINLTNQIREFRGIPALTNNILLDESAQAKADDMAQVGYFSHIDQNGNRMSYWMGLSGYDYLRAGENLAKGFNNPRAVTQAWLNSPTHYANLVNDNYTEIGIGIAEGIVGGKTTIVVVQHFGQPMPNLVVPTFIAASSILGDKAVAAQVVPLPPSTGGVMKNYDLITHQQIADSAVINTSPKGLLFMAYESLEDTSNAVAQTWDNWQGSLFELPYAQNLPPTNYPLAQILVMVIWLTGGAVLVWRVIAQL